jgi:DNA polymerase-3 subunit delta'
MCEAPLAEDSCGTCSNCQKFSKLQHIDVHYSFPTINTKERPGLSNNYIEDFRNFISENPYAGIKEWLTKIEASSQQGNISAAECREVLKKLQLRSFEGGYKFLILWLP